VAVVVALVVAVVVAPAVAVVVAPAAAVAVAPAAAAKYRPYPLRSLTSRWVSVGRLDVRCESPVEISVPQRGSLMHTSVRSSATGPLAEEPAGAPSFQRSSIADRLGFA
jgi:hypothetical protein